MLIKPGITPPAALGQKGPIYLITCMYLNLAVHKTCRAESSRVFVLHLHLYWDEHALQVTTTAFLQVAHSTVHSSTYSYSWAEKCTVKCLTPLASKQCDM